MEDLDDITTLQQLDRALDDYKRVLANGMQRLRDTRAPTPEEKKTWN